MNESERLELLESEIARLKHQISQKDVYIPICKPWENVHMYIENESIKRRGPRNRERWQWYEAVKNVVRVTLKLNNVRNLREDQVQAAMKIAQSVVKIMDLENSDT